MNIAASYLKHPGWLTKSGVGTNYFCDRTILVSVQVLKILQKIGDITVFIQGMVLYAAYQKKHNFT